MAYVFTPTCPGTGPWYIDREDCIGDSLLYINANTGYLNCKISSLSSTKLDKNIVTPTTLFIPVNFSTRTNNNVFVDNKQFAGPISVNPWWSGVQTVTLNNVPTNAVAFLAEIYYNVNAFQNNGQSLLVRKDATELWNSPADQGGPASGTINTTQRDNINYNDFKKINLDPTGRVGGTNFEAEHSVTIPIYFNTTNNTFQWFIIDEKTSGTPSYAPDYNVTIKNLGFYITVS